MRKGVGSSVDSRRETVAEVRGVAFSLGVRRMDSVPALMVLFKFLSELDPEGAPLVMPEDEGSPTSTK
jgi:hypothetical protein